MRISNSLLLMLLALCLRLPLLAQTDSRMLPVQAESRPPLPQTDSVRLRTTATLLGVGGTNLLDTYLSQEKFSGLGLTFLSSTALEKSYARWSTVMQHEANFSLTTDRSENAKELQGDYSFFWGRLRAWHFFGDRLRLQAGGMLRANVGFVYNTVNSNNPAQARLSLLVMPAGAATYRFRLFGQAWAAHYEIQLPLAGLMFSPNYGQSYYEIFSRGNYDHNIVPTTFVSAPTFRQQAYIDWQANRRIALRVGYLGHYQQSEVNQLKTHTYGHRVMIGVVIKK